ncbi:MAG: tRNA (adenosine(37)-N6)-dimethylallyltransferase MiaA [Lactovum sp.]
MKKKVLVIVGPTAVGKSALGVSLAELLNAEVISADSQQVYQGLDIGTAKVTAKEMREVPHHLLNICSVEENFSVYDFVKEANQKIKEIYQKNKTPIIVGGTGLYIQALVEGYHLGGKENHDEMRILREELERLSDEELKEKVKLSEFNRRRAIRYLELEKYGRTENKISEFDFKIVALSCQREILYERINQRVEQMMSEGLLKEAEFLFKNYPLVQASKGIGYKEFFPYFEGHISLEEAIEKVKQNSRRYSKRQMTWFRNRMSVKFYDILSKDYPKDLIEEVKEYLMLDL